MSAPISGSSRPSARRRSAPLGAGPALASGAAPSSTRPACSTGRCSRACARSPAGTSTGIDAELFEVALQGFFDDRQHAAAGPESGPAGRRRPGRGLLDCPAGGRRLQLLPVDDRAHRALRAVPGRPPGPHAEGAAARRSTPASPMFPRRGLGTSSASMPPARRCCGSASLVNVFFAVPHTFYEVRRDPLRGLLGAARARPGRASACRCGRCRTTPKTSAPSRTGSSCASWRTPCSASRSGPNGARCRARCGAGASGCSAARPSRRRCG